MPLNIFQVPEVPFDVHLSRTMLGVPYAITCGLAVLEVPEVVVYAEVGSDRDELAVRGLLNLVATTGAGVLTACQMMQERCPEGLCAPSLLMLEVENLRGGQDQVRLGLEPVSDRFMHVEQQLGLGHPPRVVRAAFPENYFTPEDWTIPPR